MSIECSVPGCYGKTVVLDSRDRGESNLVRRTRACRKCGARFETEEKQVTPTRHGKPLPRGVTSRLKL